MVVWQTGGPTLLRQRPLGVMGPCFRRDDTRCVHPAVHLFRARGALNESNPHHSRRGSPFAAVLARASPFGAFCPDFPVIKSKKGRQKPFANSRGIDTYATAPYGPFGPGVAFSGRPNEDGSARQPRCQTLFRPSAFSQGTQRLIAGWSSPVARQAHNLKVASSNLAPATKFDAVMQHNRKAALRGGLFCCISSQ